MTTYTKRDVGCYLDGGGRPREFDPHQYAIDCGWDFTAIEATAKQGVSEYDAAQMTTHQRRALLRWCREQVTAK